MLTTMRRNYTAQRATEETSASRDVDMAMEPEVYLVISYKPGQRSRTLLLRTRTAMNHMTYMTNHK